jgi:hypothetical protein
MIAWLNEMLRVGYVVLGYPESLTMAVLLVLAMAVVFAMFTLRLGRRLGIPAPGEGGLAVLSAATVTMLMTAAAVNLYVAPSLGTPAAYAALHTLAGVAVLLGVAAPIGCWLQHGSYPRQLACVALALAGTALVMLLLGPVLYLAWRGFAGIHSRPIQPQGGSGLSDFFLQ